MAIVCPLVGLRYGYPAGPLDHLLAPASGYRTDAEMAAYADRSPANIANFLEPEGRSDDRSKFVRFARSAALLGEWRRSEILVPEDAPAIYRIDLGGAHGFLVLARVDDLASRQASALASRTDQLRLLEATRTHSDPIVGMVADANGALRALWNNEGAAETRAEFNGITITLDAIAAPDDIQAIVDALAPESIAIVAGSDALAAAQEFRRDGLESTHWVPVWVFPEACAPAVLPTHRLFPDPKADEDSIKAAFGPDWTWEAAHSSGLSFHLESNQCGIAFPDGIGWVGTGTGPAANVAFGRLGERIWNSAAVSEDPGDIAREVNASGGWGLILPDVTFNDLPQWPPNVAHFGPMVPAGLVLWCLNDYSPREYVTVDI